MADVDDEFVTVQEAARLLGMGRMTFYRRLQDGVMPVYRSDRDRRKRLVRRADVEAMRMPTIAAPVAQSQGETDGK